MQKQSFKRTLSAALLSLFFLWVQILAFSRISEPVRFQLEKEQTEYSVQSDDSPSPINTDIFGGGYKLVLPDFILTDIAGAETSCLYIGKFKYCLGLIDKEPFVRSSLFKWHHSWKVDLM